MGREQEVAGRGHFEGGAGYVSERDARFAVHRRDNPAKHAICLARLTDLSACRDAPASYYFLIADQKRFVMHIHAGADGWG